MTYDVIREPLVDDKMKRKTNVNSKKKTEDPIAPTYVDNLFIYEAVARRRPA
jgi:hypothetical protein